MTGHRSISIFVYKTRYSRRQFWARLTADLECNSYLILGWKSPSYMDGDINSYLDLISHSHTAHQEYIDAPSAAGRDGAAVFLTPNGIPSIDWPAPWAWLLRPHLWEGETR